MQGKELLFFITNTDGQFASFDNGFLEYVGYPKPIVFSPDGWMELGISVDRNVQKFGLDITYSTPQKFVEDAAGILKTIFYRYGIEGTANLTILQQKLYFSDTEYGYYYDLLTKCEIDLSDYVHSGETVTAQMLDSELSRLLKANQSNTYEIPLGDDAVNVLMDGLSLKQYSQYILNLPSFVGGNHVLGLVQTSVEAKTQLGTQATTVSTDADSPAEIVATKQWIMATTIDTPMEVIGDFGVTVLPGSGGTNFILDLKWFDKTGALIGTLNLFTHSKLPLGALIQVIFDKTVTIPAGCTVYLFAHTEGILLALYNNTTSSGNTGDPNITIRYNYKFKPTMIKGYKAVTLWEKIVDKATGGKYQGVSDYLSNLGDSDPATYKYKSSPFTVYTCGDALRGFTDAVIKTSIDDYFKSANATHCLGMGILEGKLRLEPKAFWVTANISDVIYLGEGSKFKCSPALDYLFNTIKVGSPNETYSEALGDINGRYEINMTHEYTAPQTKKVAELDLTSKYRRDMYGIEYMRINLDGKTTSDSSSDNDVFELHTSRNITPGGTFTYWFFVPITITIPSSYSLDRSANPYTIGLLDSASAFNVQLSPKHCLWRHGDYIRSCMDKLESKNIEFNTAFKNTPVVTTYPNGIVIDERGPAPIYKMDPQIFKPYIIEDTTPVPQAFIGGSIIKKYVFTYLKGMITAAGFAIKTSIEPATDKQQSFQLLCAPEIDTEQFINIWQ